MGVANPAELPAMRDPDLLLSARNLCKVRRSGNGAFRLDVPGFDLRAGDRVALIGQSGSGKSTLINVLALALPPDLGGSLMIRKDGGQAGTVDARALWAKNDDGALTRLRREIFGYVQQKDGLLPFLTVEQNILLTQTMTGRHAREDALDLADRLGIGHLLRRHPAQISVGQRQRVGIVRALAHRPAVVFADEPTAALDHDSAAEVMCLLTEHTRERGVALVVATHNTRLAETFGFDRVEAVIACGARTTFDRRLATAAGADGPTSETRSREDAHG